MSERALLRFLQQAQNAVGLKGDVCILLTSSRTMRRLNRCFRGKDKPTDVISFPAVQVPKRPKGETAFAGDLAISVDIAKTNARKLGHSTSDEVKVLMLHGLLHLRGLDHEKDRGEMAAREERLRSKLRLPSGLIERNSEVDEDKRVRPIASGRLR